MRACSKLRFVTDGRVEKHRVDSAFVGRTESPADFGSLRLRSRPLAATAARNIRGVIRARASASSWCLFPVSPRSRLGSRVTRVSRVPWCGVCPIRDSGSAPRLSRIVFFFFYFIPFFPRLSPPLSLSNRGSRPT